MSYSFLDKKNKKENFLEEENKNWRSYITISRLLFFSLFIIVGCVVVSYGHYTDPGPLPSSRNIVIPKGGTDRITHTLQENGVLAKGWSSSIFFRVTSFITSYQGDIHAAELNFPARSSVAHILYILRRGRPVSHSVTIVEGVTAFHISQVLQKSTALQGEMPRIIEGSVYPQTFFYRWGTERKNIVKKMQNFMSTNLQKTWEKRDIKALQGKIDTPQQLLILASLIERETSLSQEGPQVARVFLNRLEKGMRLQTDPTVIYALSEGRGTIDHPLSRADLMNDNVYNTYKHTGLPPGPICSPSLKSLEAAARPDSGDMLYFVANGKGGHSFSKNLIEHNKHVRDYRNLQSN